MLYGTAIYRESIVYMSMYALWHPMPFRSIYTSRYPVSVAMVFILLGYLLTHWGRVTHICFGKLTIIASDNGLSPGRRQAIIWTNAGILLIETLGTNFSEISIEIYTFSFKKMHLKMSSGKWRPSCLGLNVLINVRTQHSITSISCAILFLLLYRYIIRISFRWFQISRSCKQSSRYNVVLFLNKLSTWQGLYMQPNCQIIQTDG